MSTLASTYALWLGMFHTNKNILILSITDRESTRFLDKVKIAFRHLPDWLRGETLKDNEHTLHLESGSLISSISSSESAGRSEALSLLIVDEAAFIKNIEKIYTSSYPTLSTGGSCIVISTPCGVGGFFHQTWVRAESKENNFNPIFLHWRMHPERDDAWYEDQVRQLADPKRIAQELDCEFLASGNTVISGDILKVLVESTPYAKRNSFLGIEHFILYQQPKQEDRYVMGVDVATGADRDYSAFSVIHKSSGKIVADYKAKIPIEEFAKIVVRIGNYYNYALLGIEINSGYGAMVVEKVIQAGYSNLYQTIDISTGKAKKTLGWVTTMKTRPYLISELVGAIQFYQIGIPSRRFVDELITFIWGKQDRAEAMETYNDDLIFATAIAWQMRKHISIDTEYMMPVTKFEYESQYDIDAQYQWLMGISKAIPVDNGQNKEQINH